MSPIIFSSGDSHTKGLLVLLNLGLEGITESDTDPKGRFVYYKFTPSNDRVLCVLCPFLVQHQEPLARWRFLERLQKYMENKNQGNEKKIILGDFDFTTNKMVKIKHKVLSKLIVDTGFEDIWRRENQDSPEFTHYNKSLDKNPVITDINIAKNTKINHIQVSFTDHYNAVSIDRLPSETKIGKDSWYFNDSFLYSPSATTTLLFLFKTQNTIPL